MAYTYLAIAIVAEVIATSALKASDQFTKWLPSVVVVIGYGTAFYCLSLVLRSIPLGITYAIWSGVGIALITLIGAVVFRQMLDLAALVGIGFIVTGVVIINVFSTTTSA
ncbi:MAG: multidrug efflux SMR transporter [Pseudomonadota bacterium]